MGDLALLRRSRIWSIGVNPLLLEAEYLWNFSLKIGLFFLILASGLSQLLWRVHVLH